MKRASRSAGGTGFRRDGEQRNLERDRLAGHGRAGIFVSDKMDFTIQKAVELAWRGPTALSRINWFA